ncbi:uncharacterized protein LOC117121155 [Anneissia japonica]|uniref:uncharacterized protein LOC117121155 n=1 Tax=Anneissia japonica TaxID=1529436 RepID=UPI0014257D21|nr:uncharacterized protein LOC117121155 [Anneissia japonica]
MEKELNFEVCNQSITLSKNQIDNLSTYLPLNYAYCICDNVKEIGENSFWVSFAVNTKTEEAALEWFHEFQLKSKTTMRVARTYLPTGIKNLFKKEYRCQHKTRSLITVNEKQSSKNTNCPANATIVVRRSDTKRSKNYKHIWKFPTFVKLGFKHNHPIKCAEVLRHRDVSMETETKFKQLFANGHNPASAWAAYKSALRIQYAENYEEIANDRAILPEMRWCYRLYYKTVKPIDRVKKNYFKTKRVRKNTKQKTVKSIDNAKKDTTNNALKQTIQKQSVFEVQKEKTVKSLDIYKRHTNINVPEQTIQKPSERTVQQDIKELCMALDNLKNKITAKMETEAVHEFRPAVQAFVGAVGNIKSDSVLISALSRFGKYGTKDVQRKRKLSESMDNSTKRKKQSDTVACEEADVEGIVCEQIVEYGPTSMVLLCENVN